MHDPLHVGNAPASPSALGTAPGIDRPRLGVVSYLNAKPLIEGLPTDCMTLAVPSALLGLLAGEMVNVALLPVADLLAAPHGSLPTKLRLVGSGVIAADVRSLTVVLHCQRDPASLRRVAADTDSHTSVLLLRVFCRWLWGCSPQIDPLPRDPAAWRDYDAVLLIGDKVVHHGPARPPFTLTLDLASVWRSWTGLPFVFAAWMCRSTVPSVQVATWAATLDAARDRGLARLDEIAAEHAPQRGWPPALAREYFRRALTYRLTRDHRRGLAQFLRLARRLSLPVQETPVAASRMLATASCGQVY